MPLTSSLHGVSSPRSARGYKGPIEVAWRARSAKPSPVVRPSPVVSWSATTQPCPARPAPLPTQRDRKGPRPSPLASSNRHPTPTSTSSRRSTLRLPGRRNSFCRRRRRTLAGTLPLPPLHRRRRPTRLAPRSHPPGPPPRHHRHPDGHPPTPLQALSPRRRRRCRGRFSAWSELGSDASSAPRRPSGRGPARTADDVRPLSTLPKAAPLEQTAVARTDGVSVSFLG